MRLLLIGLLTFAGRTAQAQPETDYTAYSVEGPAEAEAGANITVDIEVGSRDLSPVAYALIFRANLDEAVVVATGNLGFAQDVETVELMVTVPTGLSGRQELFLQLDPGNAILESNEFDNEVRSRSPTRILPRAGDLSVESVSGRGGRIQIGETLMATVQLRNLGTRTVQGNLRLVLSRGLRPTNEDPRLVDQSIDLAPGATRSLELSGSVPAEVGTGQRRAGVVFLPGAEEDRNLLNDAAIDPQPVTVVADSLNWTTSVLPRGVLGFSYAALLEADGGDGSFDFRLLSGSLPPGLVLNMGAISGVPSASGAFSFRLEVSSDGRTAEQAFDLEVAAVDEALLLVSDTLPAGRLQSLYDQRLIATGGEPPYTWSVAEGSLPEGLTLSPEGRLAGTPDEVGSFALRLSVEERMGEVQEKDFLLIIETSSAVLVDPDPLPLAAAGEPYDVQIGVSGGNPPYLWRLGASPLPPGLTLSSSGRLQGRPSLTGAFVFQVQVEDSSSPPLSDRSLVFVNVEDSANFSIVLPGAEPVLFRSPFERVFQVEGGVGPFSWSLVPGTALPGNVVFSNGEEQLANAGVLRGSPTSLGTYGLGVRVQDAAGRRREVGTLLAVQRTGVGADSGGCRSSAGLWCPLLLLLPAFILRRRRS
ncbi:MAG: Ig domain-containing protein [Myxococcota bacterium]